MFVEKPFRRGNKLEDENGKKTEILSRGVASKSSRFFLSIDEAVDEKHLETFV